MHLWSSPQSGVTVEAFEEAQIGDETASRWLKLRRVKYTTCAIAGEHGKSLVWDCIKSTDGVGVLAYHRDKRAFVCVRQFRPPVFRSARERAHLGVQVDGPTDGEPGMTLELVAGLHLDKVSKPECASAELYEEAGFKVDPSRMERIATHASGLGTTGTCLAVYYCELGDEDAAPGAGGGLVAEGERTEPVLVPLEDVPLVLASSRSMHIPGGLMWALQFGLERVTREERRRAEVVSRMRWAAGGAVAGAAAVWWALRGPALW